MSELPYTSKNTGAIFCAYCGEEIGMWEGCVFLFGKNYHPGCDRKAMLGDK